MFSPNLGRFVSIDPSRFKAGDVNLYRAESNNPVNNLDPSGLSSIFSSSSSSKAGEGKLAGVMKILKARSDRSKYWIGIFTNGPAKNPEGNALAIGTGHTWIAIFDLDSDTFTARGLYPANPDDISHRSPEGSGKIKDDKDTPFTIGRLIPIDKKTYDLWVKTINDKEQNPPKYHVRNMNCTTFALDILGLKDCPGTSVQFGATDENDTIELKNPSRTALYLLSQNCGYRNSFAIDAQKGRATGLLGEHTAGPKGNEIVYYPSK